MRSLKKSVIIGQFSHLPFCSLSQFFSAPVLAEMDELLGTRFCEPTTIPGDCTFGSQGSFSLPVNWSVPTWGEASALMQRGDLDGSFRRAAADPRAFLGLLAKVPPTALAQSRQWVFQKSAAR